MIDFKTHGSTEFYSPKALAPERSEAATKALRVIHFVDPYYRFEVLTSLGYIIP